MTVHLKKFRKVAGLTQEELGKIVGVRRETILRLEKAQYNPSYEVAVCISRAVGASSVEDVFVVDWEYQAEENNSVYT